MGQKHGSGLCGDCPGQFSLGTRGEPGELGVAGASSNLAIASDI